MAKTDFPALLSPGVHAHTLASIEALAVLPFPDDVRRTILFQQFSSWIGSMKKANVVGRIWIDGSFLTEKPGPNDIDCILWNPSFSSEPTQSDQQNVQRLLDKPTARTAFNLDLYLEQPTPDMVIHREAYWKGFFGYCHDRITAKGFAELTL